MMAQAMTTDQKDNEAYFKSLRQRPIIAWPTIVLLVAAYVLFIFTTYAYVQGALSLAWAIGLNSVASYMSFAVVHEASHRAISIHSRLNDWIGRIGMLLLEPAPLLPVFRQVHMQHHRFTNDPIKDPDAQLSMGLPWVIPFKWMIFDLFYFKHYLKPEVINKRPKKERIELYLAISFAVLMIAILAFAGWLTYYLLLFFIPTRIAKFFIIWVFDYLPHYPHQTFATDDPFRSTSNRVGFEWLLTPLFVYQNYHLVHHLYPTVPFYRYIKIWKAKKQYHQSQNPATTEPFGLAPIEAKEIDNR